MIKEYAISKRQFDPGTNRVVRVSVTVATIRVAGYDTADSAVPFGNYCCCYFNRKEFAGVC
jgi:hypothetical protein